MQNHVIGIDVSKKKLDICVIVDGKTRKKIVVNDESGFKDLTGWLSKLGVVDPHICMEATGCYSENITEFLHCHGFKVSVVNPVQINPSRKKRLVWQKTDSSDAQLIAKFCLQESQKLWCTKPRENRELHEINVRIDSLKMALNRLINALEKKYLNETVAKSINAEMEFIQKQIKDLKNEAEKIIQENKTLRKQFDILTSIIGVGEKTALTVLADMPDVENFDNAKQYAAFVGVTPSHCQSGTSVNGWSHISKIGSKKFRNSCICALWL